MHHHYEDITSRIPEPPRWYDECAVPRYCEFSPNVTADIYAREVALVEIACQNCRQRFRVAFSQGYPFDMRTGKRIQTLAENVRAGTLHYGDPPNAECCPSGPTMNCLDIRVLEFWRHDPKTLLDWTRVPDLEIGLADVEDA